LLANAIILNIIQWNSPSVLSEHLISLKTTHLILVQNLPIKISSKYRLLCIPNIAVLSAPPLFFYWSASLKLGMFRHCDIFSLSIYCAEFVLLSYKVVTCVVLHIRLVFKNSKYLPIVSTCVMQVLLQKRWVIILNLIHA
jgi:hypothetical protein